MSDKEERRYALPTPGGSGIFDKEFTVLHRRKFTIKRLERQRGMKASLWHVAPPRWPGASSLEEFALLLKLMYDNSHPRAHLVLWMPDRELHQALLSPIDDCDPWLPQATILSGDRRGMQIGYVYAKGPTPVDWDSKVILDERGNKGASSSHAMKFIIEKLLRPTAAKDPYSTHRIIDVFAHKSAQLPLWARRSDIRYTGYTASKKTYQSIKEKLAQREIPGIQVPLPAT